jgi:hypothetical protein
MFQIKIVLNEPVIRRRVCAIDRARKTIILALSTYDAPLPNCADIAYLNIQICLILDYGSIMPQSARRERAAFYQVGEDSDEMNALAGSD